MLLRYVVTDNKIVRNVINVSRVYFNAPESDTYRTKIEPCRCYQLSDRSQTTCENSFVTTTQFSNSTYPTNLITFASQINVTSHLRWNDRFLKLPNLSQTDQNL